MRLRRAVAIAGLAFLPSSEIRAAPSHLVDGLASAASIGTAEPVLFGFRLRLPGFGRHRHHRRSSRHGRPRTSPRDGGAAPMAEGGVAPPGELPAGGVGKPRDAGPKRGGWVDPPAPR